MRLARRNGDRIPLAMWRQDRRSSLQSSFLVNAAMDGGISGDVTVVAPDVITLAREN